MQALSQILRVALDVPLNRIFDYINQGISAQIGSRVVVPFAGRSLVGVVLEIVTETDFPQDKLKQVTHVFEDVVFDQANHQLLKFCADYYHYPIGQTILSSLPLRLRQTKPAVSRKSFVYVWADHSNSVEIPKRQIVLQRVAQALKEHKQLTEQQLLEVTPAWRKAIKQLTEMGLISAHEVIAIKPSMPSSALEPTLNTEQAFAVKQVISKLSSFQPWLLYGVTGSGKTEVYIQLLKAVLANPNAQALVLVPEINLTPQLEARFRSRLSQFSLVTLHSNLSESERLQNWLAAKSGAAKIVIGTRLSIFTPMPHLKIVIIDEEHDGSYKQQDGMRYHARDVAIIRAKQLNIPIILGSATPSLETWYNAHNAQKKQAYGLLTLKQRAVEKATLPSIFCIDTAKTPTENGLSPLLIKAIQSRLDKGEQSLLFLNRRGYAPVLHCNACQWTSNCNRCSAKLVVHLSQRRLKCHHCGYEQKIPIQCPSCGNADLKPVGVATQRIEQTLTQRFPSARIVRVDRDSMRGKNTLTDTLSLVQEGNIDILVGTQMLAKGHDFPNLTLVGVLDTDAALYSPDFRASERLFSQLMQVSGRAGRGNKAGEVLIQTSFPQHDLFHALRAQNYEDFANLLLEERKSMQFPPTSYFALLKAEASDYNMAQQFLDQALALTKNASEITIYGPIRPQVERMNAMERGHLLLQSASRQALQKLLKNWIPQLYTLKFSNRLRWTLDIDPLEF